MHVMARGIRRKAIFREEDDYRLFMKIAEITRKELPYDLYSYCLMTNHFHMLLKTDQYEIWRVMKRIMSNYARTFNQKYGYSGHLFDSRYVSRIIEDDIYLLEVSRYIHLNPVKAGMVTEPLNYMYSSYRTYAGSEQCPLLETDTIFSKFRLDPVQQYRNFVESKMSHSEMESRIRIEMREDDQWLPWDQGGDE